MLYNTDGEPSYRNFRDVFPILKKDYIKGLFDIYMHQMDGTIGIQRNVTFDELLDNPNYVFKLYEVLDGIDNNTINNCDPVPAGYDTIHSYMAKAQYKEKQRTRQERINRL